MVYLEPGYIGLEPFVNCWLNQLPPGINRNELRALFDQYLEPAIDFLRRNVRELVASVNGNLVFSLLNLLDTFIEFLRPKNTGKLHFSGSIFYTIQWSITYVHTRYGDNFSNTPYIDKFFFFWTYLTLHCIYNIIVFNMNQITVHPCLFTTFVLLTTFWPSESAPKEFLKRFGYFSWKIIANCAVKRRL